MQALYVPKLQRPAVLMVPSGGSSKGFTGHAHITRPHAIRRSRASSRTQTVAYVETQRTSAHDLSKLPEHKEAETVCLQGFGWESHRGGNGKSWWSVVKDKVPDIKAAGFTHVWLPPPSQSVAPQGYLPGQLYNLQSAYGSKEGLIELNKALLEAGVRPVADIVINHRCADEKDEHGRWTKYRDDQDHHGRAIDWGKWAITSNDPDFRGDGNPDTGDDYGAAPDLDHLNEDLRNSLVDWMAWLHDTVGFQGWRFDFVKGYGARFCAEYVERTLGTNALCVGEYFPSLRWHDGFLDYNQDEACNTFCAWLREAKHCTLFDFIGKGIVQEAIKRCEYDRLRTGGGKAPGLMGAWPEKAVTFVENHDTGSTQQHWPWPSSHVLAGYAYILTHPGMPCVFWEHYFDWGLKDEITKLMALRKRNGIVANSKLEILAADKDMYVAKIDDRVILKMGPRYDMGCHCPSDKDWKCTAYGDDWAVWERK